MRTPDGSKPIEQFAVGDWVLSRDEYDPAGPVLSQRVEEVFVRTGRVWLLTLNGRAIHTTGEHPFFAEGHGWKPLAELAVGDRLLGESGDWLTIEALEDTGRYETVYNLRVSEAHTYFVGCAETWGFSVWSHNVYHDGMTVDIAEQRLRAAGIPEETASALARAGALENVNGNGLIARLERAAQTISTERWNNLAGRSGDRYRLSRTEGQELLDSIHSALRGADFGRHTTGLTETGDGRLIFTSSDTTNGVTPGQRAVARAIFGDDMVLLAPNVRGQANGYIRLANRDLPDPYSTSPTHAETRGINAAETYGTYAFRQWASSGATHGGAACDGCRVMQIRYGVRNETGFQPTALEVTAGMRMGRFDQGGINPLWNW